MAIVAIENRNRHAPNALARDAPILAIGDHVVEAFPSPARDKFRIVDGFQRIVAEIIDGGEPLFRRPIDHRIFTAPAVGELVMQRALAEKLAGMLQSLRHRGPARYERSPCRRQA